MSSRRRAPCVWALFTVRVSTRTLRASLLSSKFCWSLLDKGGDALAMIGGRERLILQLTLQAQSSFQIAHHGGIHQLFHQAIRAGRPLGQTLSQTLHRLLKLSQGDAFISQPQALGLRTTGLVGEHCQLQGFAISDQAW